MTPASAVCLLWAATAAPAAPAAPQRGTLEEARIQITVTADTAWIIAWYRVAGPGDSLRLNAIRPDRQALILQGVAGAAGFRLDTLAGLYRLTSRPADETPTLDVRYHVVGGLERIPLFVPETPTAPGRSAVLIRVAGVEASRVAAYPFPRFREEPGDGWLARPDHLPSFIVLVTAPAAPPVPALAQWGIALLVLGATTIWLAAQWRRRSHGA